MTMHLTLGNDAWMRANFEKLKALFPVEWTQHTQQTALKLGYQLKLLGVDWRSVEEFGRVIVYLRRVNVIEAKSVGSAFMVRRHP